MFANIRKLFSTERRSRPRVDESISVYPQLPRNADLCAFAVEAMPVAVVATDTRGIVSLWNRKAEEVTGIRASEAVGKPISGFTDVLGLPSGIDDAAFAGREVVIRPRDGRHRIVWKGAARLPGADGSGGGTIEALIDISEQKELERQLSIDKNRAEDASRQRSEFLASMSHEIRTPLNGILGLAEMLAEDEPNEERRANLGAIRQCGQNLLHLINEILELSKIEAGRMSLHPATVATADAIREATATIDAGCRKKGIALSVDIDRAAPQTIEVDNHKLVQVLVNLLGNALKFTEAGSIVVKVAPLSNRRRGNLLFSVTDTGSGIPRDRQGLIFESFVQAEAAGAKGAADGTGLGLAIARRLVGLMGGEIWLESEPGKGSKFSFTIKAGP